MGGRTALRGWLVSEAISLTGTRISMVALPWFVLTTTGSATQTGLVAAAETLPMVLLKAFGGPLIDRAGARRVSIACDLGSVLAVGAVPLLHAADLLSFPLLLVLVALAGALRGPGDAAKHALVPALAEHGGVPMERVTGLAGAVERTAGMLGAAAAGGLVAWLGAAEALLVDAATFGAAAAVLALATRDLPRPEPEAEAGSYLGRLRTGWDFLRHQPLLLSITLMLAVTNMLDMAYTAVLVPVWARDTGHGAGAVGLLFAVFAGASVLGSVAAAQWGTRLPRLRTYLVAFLLCGAPRFLVLALEAPLAAVLLVIAVGGFASGFLNPLLGAVIFERIPKPLVGRVSSLTTATCFALMPLGGVLGGGLVSGASLVTALLVCGAAYFVATMAPAVLPTFRAMDERPAQAR